MDGQEGGWIDRLVGGQVDKRVDGRRTGRETAGWVKYEAGNLNNRELDTPVRSSGSWSFKSRSY